MTKLGRLGHAKYSSGCHVLYGRMRAALLSWRACKMKKKGMPAAAGAADCGEALPAHFVWLFVWKRITLLELDFFFLSPPLHSSCIHSMPAQGVEIQGHRDFWFPPRCRVLFEAPSEGQNQIHPNEKKPLFVCFSTSCLPIPFHQESIFLSLCCQRLMRLSGHTCALRKIPLLSLKLYYSAQGHDSQCF